MYWICFGFSIYEDNTTCKYVLIIHKRVVFKTKNIVKIYKLREEEDWAAMSRT